MGNIFIYILLAICVVGILFSFFLLVRNQWVYHNQLLSLEKDQLEEYLSYDRMLMKFWVWDIDKLRK